MASKKTQIKEKIEEQSSQAFVRRDRLRWLPGFLVIMLAVFMTLFEQFYFKPVQVPQGQVSLRAIRAPYDFVFDEQKAVEAVIEKQLKEFIPIYHLDNEKSRQIQAKWEEFFNGLNRFGDHIHETLRLRRRAPFKPEPLRRNAGKLQQLLGYRLPSQRMVVATNIVAVPEVSPENHHCIDAEKERFKDVFHVDSAGAHDAYVPHVGRILQARDTREVGAGIGTPVAAERKNPGLEIRH